MICERARHLAPLLLIAAMALVGCGTLPSDVKYTPQQGSVTSEAQLAGMNQVGEQCRFVPSANTLTTTYAATYDLFCGTWQQPSGRIFQSAVPGNDEALSRIALSSAWRDTLDERVTCQPPTVSTVLADQPAATMQCTLKNGDWPHLAMVAEVSDKLYFVDCVPSALPAVETALAILSGREAPTSDASSKMAQITAAISAHPFGSGDLDSYYTLIRLGNAANDGSNYAAAEQAFRSALAIQERILGPDDPGLATPIMNLALQISNQGRFPEADRLFERVHQLVAASSDPLERARYDLYTAEHETNRSNLDNAEASNKAAEREYRNLVPPSLVDAAEGKAESDISSYVDSLMLSPEGQSAVAGLAASWTLEAQIAYRAGEYGRVQALNTEVDTLLRVSALRPPGLEPRSVRLAALGDARTGNLDRAISKLDDATGLFARYGENARPVAVTLFLAGRSALAGGKRDEALALFRKGATVARTAHFSLPDDLVGEYLKALDEAANQPNADRDAVTAEFFEAAQLIQGTVTGRVVAQAFARLAAGNEAARELLRQMQDDDLKLQQLYALRDRQTRLATADIDDNRFAAIDDEIVATQKARAEADAAAQSASPDYAQLISKEVSVDDVQHVLAEHEALLTFVVASKFVFGVFVQPGRVEEYRIDLTQDTLADAVAHLRATILPQEVNGKATLPVFDVTAAHELYQKLLGPVEGQFDKLDRLVVVPSGALSSLPLEVLVSQATPPVTDGNYIAVPFLVKRLAISYVPAPQSLVVLRNNTKPSTAPNPYVGFGDFTPATRAQIAASYPPFGCVRDFLSLADLEPLPGSREEIDATGKLVFHAPDQDMLLGADFTKAQLTRMDLTKFRIIHFATHALLPSGERCRSEPVIGLSADPKAPDASSAFLGLSEVLSMKLDADLVLLSACDTAAPGTAGTSDALSGLAKAFFFAGARGLLVTHWQLDDNAGPLLTALTLSPWDQGRDTTVDLQGAQLFMLVVLGNMHRPGYTFFTHPFAWAPFVLIGDGLRAPTPSQGKPAATVRPAAHQG